jgi:predicted transcriptional regulator
MAADDTKSVFDVEPDPEEEARLDAEAEKAYREGRVVPHAEVVRWLKSWGTDNVLPMPKPKPR